MYINAYLSHECMLHPATVTELSDQEDEEASNGSGQPKKETAKPEEKDVQVEYEKEEEEEVVVEEEGTSLRQSKAADSASEPSK